MLLFTSESDPTYSSKRRQREQRGRPLTVLLPPPPPPPLSLSPLSFLHDVSRFPLKKMPLENPTAQNVIHSTDYLSQKYSGFQAPLASSKQAAFGGAGGQGRKMKSDKNGEDLFWTQNPVDKNSKAVVENEEALGGGHGVPLSSEPSFRFSPFASQRSRRSELSSRLGSIYQYSSCKPLGGICWDTRE